VFCRTREVHVRAVGNFFSSERTKAKFGLGFKCGLVCSSVGLNFKEQLRYPRKKLPTSAWLRASAFLWFYSAQNGSIYRRFGTTYRSNFQVSRIPISFICLNLEDGIYKVPRNVGKLMLVWAEYYFRKVKISPMFLWNEAPTLSELMTVKWLQIRESRVIKFVSWVQ